VNLEQAIHGRWADDATLESLLPAAGLTTGISPGATAPYATLNRLHCRTVLRSNAGDAVDEVALRVSIWHDNHDDGRAILEAVQGAFDRSAFSLADGQRVVEMRRTDDRAVQDGDKWNFVIDFLVRVYLPSGT